MEFSEAYARYRVPLQQFVQRRVRNAVLAEDIAQEAFFRALRNWASFDDRRPIWPWLAAIARNLMIDAAKAASRREEPLSSSVEDEHALAVETEQPETVAVAKELGDVIRATLGSLGDRDRKVLIQRCEDELSYDDIATDERVSRDSVKAALKRARGRFRVAFAAAYDEAEDLVVAATRATRRLSWRIRSSPTVRLLFTNVHVGVGLQVIALGIMATALSAGASVGALSGVTSSAGAASGQSAASFGRHGESTSGGSDDARALGSSAAPSAYKNSEVSVRAGIDKRHSDRRTVRVERYNADPGGSGRDKSHLTVDVPCSSVFDAVCSAIDALTNQIGK